MKTILLTIVSMAILIPAFSQDSTETNNPFTISGYVEAYYNHDFNKPEKNTLPGFLYNFNRANEVNINLAFIKANYSTGRLRGNVALATGTYMNANYNAEPGLIKNILEANVGIKLLKKGELWLDAGVMPSHLGFESAVGKDNWTLTRSLLAENSPYFETGVKLGFTTKDQKLYLSAMYLNGWQRIQRIDGNTTPAFGTQVTYKPNGAIALNYSTFIGNDKPDSLRQMRYFHNVYAIFMLNSKLGITTGFDIGSQQKDKGGNAYDTWFSPVVIARYMLSDKFRLAARGEYYQDKNGVIISADAPGGFKTWGYSFNFDYVPFENVMWRVEARGLSGEARFAGNGDQAGRRNYFITTSLGLAF